MKEKITLSIDKEILSRLKKKAEEKCWSISKKVEKFFREELKND